MDILEEFDDMSRHTFSEIFTFAPVNVITWQRSLYLPAREAFHCALLLIMLAQLIWLLKLWKETQGGFNVHLLPSLSEPSTKQQSKNLTAFHHIVQVKEICGSWQ